MANCFDANSLYARTMELDDNRSVKVYQSEVGDVGCVVWDAAIVLSKFYELLSMSKPMCTETQSSDQTSEHFLQLVELVHQCNKGLGQVLELGAGTGCVGIVTACMG